MKNFSSRFARVVIGTSLAVALALTAGSVGLNFWFASEAHKADLERRDTTSALITAQDEYRDLYEEYTAATGNQPEAATPNQLDSSTNSTKSTPGAAGATGPQGPRGLMGLPGQIGPQGEPGEAGAPGAPGEVGAKGASGANGKDGLAGSQGVAGPAGPPGADSTVPGPAGPAGPAGATGAEGRGVMSMMCGEDGSWIITYTDNTTQTTNGPCRVFADPVQ